MELLLRILGVPEDREAAPWRISWVRVGALLFCLACWLGAAALLGAFD